MKITRIQAGRNTALKVSLSYVMNELSSAQFSNIIERIRQRDLTITVWTRSGIRVQYIFPAALAWVMTMLANVAKNPVGNRTAQLLWLSGFTPIRLTEQHILNEGGSRVCKALLKQIDEVFAPGSGLRYEEALASLPA